jgi:hypothetical protein
MKAFWILKFTALLLIMLFGAASFRASAQDTTAIESVMRSAMPAETACSSMRGPFTCEFNSRAIDYRIVHSDLGGTSVDAVLHFKQGHAEGVHLARLVQVFATFAFSVRAIEACIDQAVESTKRGFMGREEVRNERFVLVCTFYRGGNATFAGVAYVLDLRAHQ